MLLTDFDALSFDCYGTLIDWETGIAAALAPWAARHGVTATPDELMSAFAAIETAVQGETPTMRYPEVLAETMRRIGRQVGAEVSDAEALGFGDVGGRMAGLPRLGGGAGPAPPAATA